LRKLVRLTLEPEGYVLHEAQTADECLSAVARLNPDLVILDVMTPGVANGFEACAALKHGNPPGGPLVLLLTARGQQIDRARGRDAGADAYIIKPFSPLQLAETVRDLVDKRTS